MNLRTPSYFTVSHTRRTGGVVANSYSSRSCVWGVTARSILYAIRNGARRCRTPLDTGAPTKARSHIPLSSHFVSNEWLSLSATGRTRPSRPASTRCPPIADASSTRRRVRDQVSACRRSSFSHPMLRIPPTTWSFLASDCSRRTTYYVRHNPLPHTRLSPPGLVAR